VSGSLTSAERARLAKLDERFSIEEWLAGPARTPSARPRQVKVRAGVWTFSAVSGPAWVAASVVRDVVTAARLRAPGLNGRTEAAQRAITGVSLAQVSGVLAGFGEPGRRLAAAFAAADGKRI